MDVFTLKEHCARTCSTSPPPGCPPTCPTAHPVTGQFIHPKEISIWPAQHPDNPTGGDQVPGSTTLPLALIDDGIIFYYHHR